MKRTLIIATLLAAAMAIMGNSCDQPPAPATTEPPADNSAPPPSDAPPADQQKMPD